MKRMLVVGEDALCCALGERLIATALPGWQLAGTPIDKKGVTKLQADLDRYVEQARHVQPVLCLADTDRRCAVTMLRSWLPDPAPERFVLRFAITEAESWLLADRDGFSAAFQVPANKLPNSADEIDDPKRLVLNLLARSKKRIYRDEVVSRADPSKPGAGYNVHLCAFARQMWDAPRARQASASLDRALKRLEALEGATPK